ncbi:MAG TPA: Rieske 2Fe-2S domain-containing protein [Blastocatellia bacterium]|nr:Rieske 2Fe-2S domain-containing protein [Blastocatellia bacterium]
MKDKRYHKIGRVDEIAPGSGKKVEIDGDGLAIFNFNGQFYALNDLCPHRGAPLSEGFLDAGKVFCPWHCFDFDLKTGDCGMVPSMRVEAYPIKIEGDEIFVLH